MALTNAGIDINEGRAMVAQGGAKITAGLITLQRVNKGNTSQTLTQCQNKCHEASAMSGRIVLAVEAADRLLREYLIKMVS
jgi:hypothetical protein